MCNVGELQYLVQNEFLIVYWLTQNIFDQGILDH